ncbi:hypothetical protein AR437_07070 [Christensenella hongkongensis]|uniref:MerR family transcriptional regulator n=1 Tax=Christensenella hongkongensis TaxID=270498 RepID=UPI000740410A|nr:MerR family transcriptional regulator [Christensenella hongkongensis]KUJ30754.1 hypothetical protein AR437_07070 [Christensenella hongkongensis]
MEYSIKQVAGMLNITEHTIRYYTDINLFPCRRGRGNRRIFDEESVNWLIGIKNLRACGMSIESIKEYCDLCLRGEDEIARRFEIIQEQMKIAKSRLDDAQRVYDYMVQKVGHYQEIMDKRIADDTNPSTWNKTEQSVTA